MTKIDIFSGFLGAGNTTLIKKLIKEAYAGEKLGWHCIPCSDGNQLYPIPQIRDSLRQTIREVLGC